MKNRIKKKLLKKQAVITDVVYFEPTFCRVLATKEDLVYIGCDLDLTGCLVEYIKDYPDGYSEVRVENKEISEILEKPIYEYYDIPKYLLNFEF